MSLGLQTGPISFVIVIIIVCYRNSFHWLRMRSLSRNYNGTTCLTRSTSTPAVDNTSMNTQVYHERGALQDFNFNRLRSPVYYGENGGNGGSSGGGNGGGDSGGDSGGSSESGPGEAEEQQAREEEERKMREKEQWAEQERRGRITSSAYYNSGWDGDAGGFRRGSADTPKVNLGLVTWSSCVVLCAI